MRKRWISDSRAMLISQASDGVKAFTGMVTVE